ncbi:MAG: LytTR family DNA-binding domain-containing protein [Saprospiraceae bacterium]
MKWNCLIVDDEPLALDLLEHYIKRITHFGFVNRCEDAISAFNILKGKNKIDLLFLDIEMPQVSGLELLKSLDSLPKVILTTAHRQYAIEGFELDVLDYLVKPIGFPRFMKAVNKFFSQSRHADLQSGSSPIAAEKPSLFIKVDKRMVKVYLQDILFIESLKDYIRLHTETGNYVVYQSLTAFSDQLPRSSFLRIHRSFTIAIEKIAALEGNYVEINGQSIPISRNKKGEVMQLLQR